MLHSLRPFFVLAGITLVAMAGFWMASSGIHAQPPSDDAVGTNHALAEARAEGASANARAERLEADAERAQAAADRTARDAASVAALIQQAEANITADEVTINLINHQREILHASIAERQRPLLRLTAALQLLSRRPLAVALLHPGSVEDAMHLHALLDTMLPAVRQRTAALRGEIAHGRALQAQAQAAKVALRIEEKQLERRRRSLAALETRQRLAARDVSGNADRETERALALGEQARDLSSLVATLARDDAMADDLSRLPGPVLRGEISRPSGNTLSPGPANTPERLPGYTIPAAGHLVSGFHETAQDGQPTQGIAITARAGAQIIAPGAGRVAFAGPYRGYGQIVIITHDGGWTSLITGLAELSVRVGDRLVTGSPLGVAGPGRPILTLELRYQGVPVNPLDQMRS